MGRDVEVAEVRPQRQVEIGYEVRQLFHVAPVEGDQAVAGIGIQRWAGHGLGAYRSLAGRDVILRQAQVIEGPGQLARGVDDALLVLEDEEPIGPEDVGPRGDGLGVEPRATASARTIPSTGCWRDR